MQKTVFDSLEDISDYVTCLFHTLSLIQFIEKRHLDRSVLNLCYIHAKTYPFVT